VAVFNTSAAHIACPALSLPERGGADEPPGSSLRIFRRSLPAPFYLGLASSAGSANATLTGLAIVSTAANKTSHRGSNAPAKMWSQSSQRRVTSASEPPRACPAKALAIRRCRISRQVVRRRFKSFASCSESSRNSSASHSKPTASIAELYRLVVGRPTHPARIEQRPGKRAGRADEHSANPITPASPISPSIETGHPLHECQC
jgi:hypothetical protein